MVRWLIPCVLLAAPAAAAPGASDLKNPFERTHAGEATVTTASLGLKNPFATANDRTAEHSDRLADSGLKNPFTATPGPGSDLRDPFAVDTARRPDGRAHGDLRPRGDLGPDVRIRGDLRPDVRIRGDLRDLRPTAHGDLHPADSAPGDLRPGDLKNPWATGPAHSGERVPTPGGDLKDPWATDREPARGDLEHPRAAGLRDPFAVPPSAPRSELLDPFAPARSGGSDLRDPWAPRAR